MSHTPGPWHAPDYAAKTSNFGGWNCRVNAGGIGIAKAYGDDQGTVVANARLIAAAPDLYAAAKDAQCACTLRERDSGHLVGCWMPALTDAIAKAEGRE